MFLAIFVFNITHPGSILIGRESELPSLRETLWGKRKGKKLLSENGEELVGNYEPLEGKDAEVP